ncbi:hypothetical protein, partial [Microcoleus sp. F4-D5]|uniref:hypothetical protein n=1 Tax=Microcoleus sp. F4-D5 TaxID=2818760 RepID=UPI002FD335EF
YLLSRMIHFYPLHLPMCQLGVRNVGSIAFDRMKQLPFVCVASLEIVAAITLDIAFGSSQFNDASARNYS